MDRTTPCQVLNAFGIRDENTYLGEGPGLAPCVLNAFRHQR